MAIVPPAQSYIETDETQYKSGNAASTMTKIAANINNFNTTANSVVGEIKPIYLTYADFAASVGFNPSDPVTTKPWALLDGANVSGSAFTTATGISVLPDMISNEAFLGQAANDGELGNFEASQNKSHTHNFTRIKEDQPNNNVQSGPDSQVAVDPFELEASATDPQGQTNAVPNNYKMNFVIKIN